MAQHSGERTHNYRALMSSWRRSPVVAAVTISIFLLVQLALPIARFDDTERGTRFAWHMFSGARGIPEFVVKTADGDRDVVLENYMARVRVDIDLVNTLPPHLCQVYPNAMAVSWDGGELRC